MSGKIQNEDIKSAAELAGQGAPKDKLPNADKIFITPFGLQKTLGEAIQERLIHGTPMEMHQGYPPDAKLYFEPSVINTIDGKARTTPPVKSQIPNVVASSINFQTGVTTGGVFDCVLPSTSVGSFRRLGFTLLSNGVIKGIFSAEAGSIGALANPGTVFVKGSLPIGYIDLEATGAPGGIIWNKNTTNNTNFPITTTKNMGAPMLAAVSANVTKASMSVDYTSGVGDVFVDVYLLPAPGSPPGVLDVPIATSDPVDITTLPVTTGTWNPALTDFTFSTPVPVVMGNEYAFVLRLSNNTAVVQANRVLGNVDPTINQVFRNTDFSTTWFYTNSDVELIVEAASNSTQFKTAGSATNIIEHKVGSTYRIFGFGSGGGAGGGAGDTTAFEEGLQRRLEDSLWGWYTPNIVAVQEETLTDIPNTTAVYDIANSEYDFTVGQIYASKQLYGSRFRAEDTESVQCEVYAEWSVDDPAAVYQVSKNGGVNYESITMERIGDSNKYRGIMVFTEPAGTAVMTYPLANASSVVELRGPIGNPAQRTAYAVKLPAIASGTKRKVTTGTVYVNKLGAPTGELMVKIVEDNGGIPGTTVVGQNSTIISIGSLSAGDNAIPVVIPSILVEGTYWLVVEGNAGYLNTMTTGVNAVRVRVDNTTPNYSEGESYNYFNGAWVVNAGNQMVFQLFSYDYDLRLKITASQTAALTASGIFYGESVPTQYIDQPAIQRFDLDGNVDTTQLTITKFLPDATTCKVYVINSGQVLRYPAFGIDGHKLIFASGQFQIPGQIVTVIVDQTDAGAIFDNSDTNAALLAANRLGSTDPSIDKSAAGEGIMLRADNGVLVEASLKWNGAAYEWVFATV